MKTEKELAQELGIDRSILKGWRQSGYITGWEKSGNTIVFLPEGESEVREKLKDEIGVDDIGEPLPPPEDPYGLKIINIPRNPKLVICEDNIYVRVRDNKNFLKGMMVQARPPATGERVWVMIGRCPRWRGKW